MQIAKYLYLSKYALLMGWGPMQVAKYFNKICIAGGPGANANCKNIYDEI